MGCILWIYTRSTVIKNHTVSMLLLPAEFHAWGLVDMPTALGLRLLPIKFLILQAAGRATARCSEMCLNLIPSTRRQLCLSIERLWKIVLCFIRHSRQAERDFWFEKRLNSGAELLNISPLWKIFQPLIFPKIQRFLSEINRRLSF